MTRIQTTAVIVSLCVLGSAAVGDVLLEDDFAAGGATPAADEYQSAPWTTDGTDNNSIHGQDPPRTGFVAAAWSINSTPFANLTCYINPAGLSYTDSNGVSLATTPGHVAYTNGFGSHGVTRSAGRNTTISGPMTTYTPPEVGVYISMLLRVNDTILHTFDDAIGDLRGPHVTVQHGSRPINFSIQTNATTGAVEASAILEKLPGNVDRTAKGVTDAVSAGQTVFIVVHLFSDGGDKYELWINPPDLTDESAGKDYSGADPGDSGYVENNAAYGLESVTFDPGGQTAAGGVFELDELRIGTSWADVVPYSEPSPRGTVIVVQ